MPARLCASSPFVIPTELGPLLAVAAATLSEDGILLKGNAGFLRLIGTDRPQPIGTHVAELFIQPDFATLLHACPGTNGEIHHGLLKLGE